ncbi:hypothetical protein H0H81_001665 [Sphagnurus paluster]|uniref:phosphoglucomutase (alpha-D-glucose-1,6-bisphosphate-dependent) n=1 Tax=Sphagnurus paluster TaxID=117069 RepID=A0A9P7K7U3_9AGAR|nr:hypothetical protein H0H81_001665 [Sphagnurus paluster]
MEHLFISSAPPATIVGSGLDDHHVAKRARTVTPINANITEVAPWSASTQPNVSFTSSVNMPPPTLTAPYMSRTSPSQNIRTTFRRARPSQPRQEWENYAMELESPHCFYRCLWDDGVHCEYIAKKQAMKRHVELTHLKYKSVFLSKSPPKLTSNFSPDLISATYVTSLMDSTGDKDHVCPEEDCPRAYGDASRLLRHRVRVHGYIVRPTAPKVKEITTKPFDGQKPGTSGLRKRVKVFQQEHYTENFVQAIFDAIEPNGATIVIGGDGRYFSPETVQTILKIASANGVAKFIVGKDSILSTPAASNIIRKYKAYGGILLTASHNPGGPDNDFGIKYNVSNGGPAPEKVTNAIYERTKTIRKYKIIEAPPVDLSEVGDFTYGPSRVSIIDSVADYQVLLESIFDFPLIKSFLDAHRSDYRVLFDGLNGVTGPYAKAIFVSALGLPESSIQNCVPLPDFGGGHPDPNLTYAHTLVDAVEKNGIEFGAASDGDGDRNMIYGKGAFVNPSDSLAIIANWAHVIPYFQRQGGVKGLARSMPTSKAVDLVAQKKGIEYFEVPTGWKFFGNLMDAGRLSICGEESFGTGSDHIREKDGLWAVVAWLNIIAAANAKSPKKLVGINDILQAHYEEYGRSFFSRYDYEEVPSEGANALVAHIATALKTGSLTNTVHKSKTTSTQFTISGLYDFEYTDPIDKSVSSNQGQVITFSDGSRVVFRLSGTGSQGATVRMYVERYVAADAGPAELGRDAADGLKGLIEVALEITKLKQFLGREEPTVITVSLFH